MEVLDALEKKVVGLLESANRLKEQSSTLLKENEGLKERVQTLEARLEIGSENSKELISDRAEVKTSVDGLIADINSFIDSED
ncbi:cell division protein ZapB [bacterium]|jgi:hypothetical protein|nr:cell division protein ZapB [bacterium]